MLNTLHEDKDTFLFVFRSLLLRMRNVSDKAVEKITTQISGSETIFLFFESPTVYEIMWENKMHPYRPQVTIRRMNFGS